MKYLQKINLVGKDYPSAEYNIIFLNEENGNVKIVDSYIPTQQNYEIWYKTNDNQPITPTTPSSIQGSIINVISNVFDEKVGYFRMKFDGDIHTIGNTAFPGKSSLTEVILPQSVRGELGTTSFTSCSNLAKINIPNSITSIGSSAFANCVSLKEINIPNSITSIGSSAFANCASLKEINIPDSVAGIESSAFVNCSGLTSITIPNSVTTLGGYIFEGCKNVLCLNYNSPLPIDANFTGPMRSKLQTVIIGDDVTSIGSGAFASCTSLKEINIPNSVTSIDSSAFANCSGLTSITIPNSVTTFGSRVFEGCNNVLCLNYNSPLPIDANFAGSMRSKLQTVIIGDDVTDIDDNTFSNCSNLTSVTIGNSITSIGQAVFSNCPNLMSLTIPSSVTSIGYGAFANCASLKEINIPDSVAGIGSSAFANCSGLTSITVGSGLINFGQPFIGCSAVEYLSYNSIELNNSITTQLNKGLKTLHIGDNVNVIGTGTFYNFSELETITFGKNLRKIDSSAFSSCSGITSLNLSDSIEEINDHAFYNCVNVKDLHIPSGLTEISEGVFNGLKSLETLDIPENITSIGSSGFCFCNSLTSLTIPSSVTSISMSAFYAVSNVKYLNYQSPTAIDKYTIKFPQLETLIIGDAVSEIGDYSFASCKKLPSVTLGNGITKIDNYAFKDCEILSSITYNNNEYFCVKDIEESLINNNVIVGTDVFKNTNLSTIRMVDLGLPSGILWADANVGATKPEEYGKYFQWGDTVGYEGDEAKAHSTWSTAPFNNGSAEYDANYFSSVSGSVCPKDILASQYDAATKFNPNYCMPILADFFELNENTITQWYPSGNTEFNGVAGCKFTSKVEGYTDKFIFIPAGGAYENNSFGNGAYSAYIWTASLYSSDPSCAAHLYIDSSKISFYASYHKKGFNIRPIKLKKS